VDVLETSPARLEHARALTDLGGALRRANRRADARIELERGLELASQCGALVLAGRARVELRAAGGRVAFASGGSDGGVGGSAADQLTTTERRVAELAVAGRSNPEIAQALFVTRKTIETHLGHVYRKLDIASRHELATALSGTS
jgi:DNA-binding CsgD family transcriptional regulator